VAVEAASAVAAAARAAVEAVTVEDIDLIAIAKEACAK
jgi:hypothetical protein